MGEIAKKKELESLIFRFLGESRNVQIREKNQVGRR